MVNDMRCKFRDVACETFGQSQDFRNVSDQKSDRPGKPFNNLKRRALDFSDYA